MSGLLLARVLVAALAAALVGLGLFLLTAASARAVRALPRARALGMALSALCWVWVAAELLAHPIDFLAFLTPARIVVGTVVCVPLTWVLLSNLLCARAVGGLLMLWPMPVILAVRDQVTLWRLAPVSIGYLSLTFGMFVVFYPWILRVACDRLADGPSARKAAALAFLAMGALSACALCALGKVVGE